jgi:hypothetical protein
VVILVDEYDAPILNHLDDAETAKNCAEVLADFYSSFKEADEHIRFIFITGISQLARLAIGQSPNNFMDISLDEEFADICGFTVDDLDRLFEDRYEETLVALKRANQLPSCATASDLRQKILQWYDGYNFRGEKRLLNPISVLSFFAKKELSGYWIKTGPPLFSQPSLQKIHTVLSLTILMGTMIEPLSKSILRHRSRCHSFFRQAI